MIIDVGSSVEEEFDDVMVAGLGSVSNGVIECGSAKIVGECYVCAAIEEGLDLFDIAF